MIKSRREAVKFIQKGETAFDVLRRVDQLKLLLDLPTDSDEESTTEPTLEPISF